MDESHDINQIKVSVFSLVCVCVYVCVYYRAGHYIPLTDGEVEMLLQRWNSTLRQVCVFARPLCRLHLLK